MQNVKVNTRYGQIVNLRALSKFSAHFALLCDLCVLIYKL
jgi:hypothetical protein